MIFKNLKKELQYDPAVPLSGIYPEYNTDQKDTGTPIFTAALFYNSQDMEAT